MISWKAERNLPIGRHSLMQTGWANAGPFTAEPIVSKWSAACLGSG